MPLSPAQSWRCSYAFTPDLDPVSEAAPPQPSFPVHHALALLRVTLAFSRAPLLGALVGGVGTVALLHQHHTSAAPVPRIESPKPHGVVTFGSDGLRLLGTFHPWLRIRQSQVHEHLALHFFDGREWHFHNAAARHMNTDAERRMRWAQSVRPAYRGSAAGGFRYREALGLPRALRVSVTMTKRVSDYRRLDDLTKLRVLYSMADLNTRETFVEASGLELRKRWMRRPMSHE